jgi:hypothetical protein
LACAMMWPARKRPPDPRYIPIALQGDGTSNGYYIMSVRGTKVVMRYKAASLPADYQMRITVAPVFEQVPRQRRPAAASRSGLQSRQLHADAGFAKGGGEIGEDRCQGCQPWPVRHVPIGRGRRVEKLVPENLEFD